VRRPFSQNPRSCQTSVHLTKPSAHLSHGSGAASAGQNLAFEQKFAASGASLGQKALKGARGVKRARNWSPLRAADAAHQLGRGRGLPMLSRNCESSGQHDAHAGDQTPAPDRLSRNRCCMEPRTSFAIRLARQRRQYPRFSPARGSGATSARAVCGPLRWRQRGIRQRLARTQARYRNGRGPRFGSAACVAHVAGHLPIQFARSKSKVMALGL